MPTTWSEYLISRGFSETVGRSGGQRVSGKLNPGIRFSLGNPERTLTGRYRLPVSAGPVEEEASFVDPSVLDEYAKANGIDLVPADETARQDIRYAAIKGQTFYAAVLLPWLRQRGEGGDIGGGLEVVEDERIGKIVESLDDLATAALAHNDSLQKMAASQAITAGNVADLAKSVADLAQNVAGLRAEVRKLMGAKAK